MTAPHDPASPVLPSSTPSPSKRRVILVDTSRKGPQLVDTSPQAPRLDPADIARAFGAHAVGTVAPHHPYLPSMDPNHLVRLRHDPAYRAAATASAEEDDGTD